MTSPLKILHIFGRMNRGGAELRTVEIVRRLDRSQYVTHFCALSGLHGELDEEIVAVGGEVHRLPLDLPFAARLLRLIRRQRFDVVHSHVFLTSGFILGLAKAAGVPLRIAHFRASHDGRGDSPWRRVRRRVLRRAIDRCASRIVAVSDAALRAAWRPDYERDPRCEVIYNGIDLRPFAAPDPAGVRREFGLPPNGPLYIHVGSFRPVKNHEKLLSVFAHIARLQPEARLLLVGQGTEDREMRLRRLTRELALEGRVRFAGLRRDAPRLVGAADLMLFPSRHEGLPGAVLEAAAAGTPVLAGDLPVIREIAACLPGVHALPLSADDGAWAAAARALAQTGEPGRRQRAAAFAAGPFTLEAAVAAHRRLWDAARAPAERRPRCMQDKRGGEMFRRRVA